MDWILWSLAATFSLGISMSLYKLPSRQYRVDSDSLITKLGEINIKAKTLAFTSDSSVEWLRETTVLVTQKD